MTILSNRRQGAILHLVIGRAAKLTTSMLAFLFVLQPLAAAPTTAAGLPSIGWVKNAGQWDPTVAYRAQTTTGPVFLLNDASMVYETLAPNNSTRVIETLVAHSVTKVVPRQAQPTRVSYLYGADPATWQRNLASHSTLSLQDAYPGIDMELRLNNGTVEKLFNIAPGSDAAQIRLRSARAPHVSVDPDGQLLIRQSPDSAPATQSVPVAWQMDNDAAGTPSHRTPVDVQWVVFEDNSYGFQVDDYDTNRELIIDPILQLSYFGGSLDDSGRVLLHSNGDPYLIGTTLSTDLPATIGGVQETSNANQNPFTNNDIFIARFSADLSTLMQATYLGGTENEFNPDALEAPNGDLIVAGVTESLDFPGATGGAVESPPGTMPNNNLFIARISADLSSGLQSTYYGGSADEGLSVLLLDDQGDIYVQGETGSNDLLNTAGGAQPTRGDNLLMVPAELFVAKIAGDLTNVQQATYLGGTSFDNAASMTLTTAGIYVGGFTQSDDLPGTTGAAQTTLTGEADAFVTLMNPELTAITRTTYFGGSEFESAVNVQELGGSLYIWGLTQSPDLPNTSGGAQPIYGGGEPAIEQFDGFIALLDPQLTAVTQATFVGGSGLDVGNLFRNGNDNLYFSGITTSTDLPAVNGAAQTTFAGGSDSMGDAFVTVLNPELTNFIRSTYFGGAGDDSGFAITSATGEVFLTGITNSSDLPGTTGGLQESFGGVGEDNIGDIFIARFTADLTTLNQATYFGGEGDESGSIRFLDSGDNLYLVGDTTSTQLPTTPTAPQTELAGGEDMLIALITANLSGTDTGGGGPIEPSGPIFGAALPGQRVHTQGNPGVTFFATTINNGTTTAVDCGLALASLLTADFSYQTTNTANELVGTINTPVDIPAGSAQSYLFTITPTQSFPATEVALDYDCTNTDPVTVISGVNTVNVLALDDPSPDVIAITLTPSSDGIARIPGTSGSIAVAMASVNVGTAGDIIVATDTNGVDLGTTVTLCQTEPTTGACLSPPAAEVPLTIGAGATPTFSFFITASQAISLDPAVNRLNVRFFQGAVGGTQIGQSSFALFTETAN